MLKKITTVLLIALLSLSLASCKFLFSKIRIIEIQQGNEFTQEEVAQLEKGMSKAQVRALLGDPVLITTFNQHRWEYVYTLHPPKRALEERRLHVYFDGRDRVASYSLH